MSAIVQPAAQSFVAPTFPAVAREHLDTLQINLGYRCNQACSHCHVDAGPSRVESMSRETLDQVFAFAREANLTTIDITGGAPEINPQFVAAVEQAHALGVEVIDRCNLTILVEPGFEFLAGFLATHRVHVIASLPCYSAENVDAQRGHGIFDRSIAGVRQLNLLGYGIPGSGLELDFVFNPQGPRLPGPGADLERDYKRELAGLGVSFNRLLTITNMPIKRFRHALVRDGQFEDYMHLLVTNHNAANMAQLMCRRLISVDWQGYVYDCDFNQMLDLDIGGKRTHISELSSARLKGEAIKVDSHCFGCSAGSGSSCGGALTP